MTTPDQDFKWEVLNDAPKPNRVRKVLNYDHMFPPDTYVHVGETYSPDIELNSKRKEMKK